MATYWNGTTLAVSSTVAQTLGSFTVPANSYFIGQVSIGNVGTVATVLISGATAAFLALNSSGSLPNAMITAGPGQVITATGTATVSITGVILVNSPNP